jgi:chaperonin GroES
MNVKPLHDRIIVRPIEDNEQNIGGIVVPESAEEKPLRGEVVLVGAGKARDAGKRPPLDIKAGDTIIFGKFSGQEVKLEGEQYLIMREDEVLAVIDPLPGDSPSGDHPTPKEGTQSGRHK